MKNLLKVFGIFLLASSLVFFTSCGDDEIIIDPGDGDVNVADGTYLAKSGADPVSSAALVPETVEAESFGSQARDGFVAGYIFLEAGSYNIVTVASKEITSTLGGSATTEMDDASGCDFNEYTLISTSDGGAAFSVATSGLYKVTYDQMTNEAVLYQIIQPNIIGSGTPGGWGTDTDFTGSVTAAGGTWTATDIVLRSGEWKLRFNCRWNLDRRIDVNAGFDPSNGYQLFTNFGGSADELLTGNDGSNAVVPEEGTYDITVTWSPQSGWAIDLNRTGDAPDLTFDPNDFNFGVIGDATALAWDTDRNMIYKKDGDVHAWYGVVTLADAGEFKFRTNDNWDFSLGGALPTDGTSTDLVKDGSNIPTPGAGQYYITIKTADDGMTWQGTMVDFGWSVIGAGSPSGTWEDDTDLVADGFDTGVTTYSLTGMFSMDEWKFRAGHDWPLNLGGDLATLILDGGNFTLAEAGMYKITFTFDGADYSASAEKL